MNSQAKPKPLTLKSLAERIKFTASTLKLVDLAVHAFQRETNGRLKESDERLAKLEAAYPDTLAKAHAAESWSKATERGFVELSNRVDRLNERVETVDLARVNDWNVMSELVRPLNIRFDEVAIMVGNLSARIEHAENCIESDAINPEDVESLKRQVDGLRTRVDILDAAKEDAAARLEDVDRELVGLDGKVSTLEHEQKQISHVLFTLKHESRIQELEAENRKTIANANTISGSLRAEAKRFDARMVEFERSAQTLADAANFQKNALETLAASWMKQHTADHEELERLKTAFGLLANNVDGRLAGIAEALKPVDVELVHGESQTPSPNEFTVAQRAGRLLSIMSRFEFPLEIPEGLELWTAAAMLADSVGLDWKAYMVEATNNGKGR